MGGLFGRTVAEAATANVNDSAASGDCGALPHWRAEGRKADKAALSSGGKGDCSEQRDSTEGRTLRLSIMPA